MMTGSYRVYIEHMHQIYNKKRNALFRISSKQLIRRHWSMHSNCLCYMPCVYSGRMVKFCNLLLSYAALSNLSYCFNKNLVIYYIIFFHFNLRNSYYHIDPFSKTLLIPSTSYAEFSIVTNQVEFARLAAILKKFLRFLNRTIQHT